jgi:pimeloyl-ACP methyl ester carboxylesterase
VALEPESVYTDLDGVRLHHLDWGGTGPVVVCLHGLTRSAHDFDAFARAVSGRFRVLCLDARGRGGSDWTAPDTYHHGRYVADLGAFLDAHQLDSVSLIGTSMGGVTSMLFSSQQPARVERVVLNDIGAVVDAAGLARIREYVANAPERFADLEAVARWQEQTNPNPRMSHEEVLEWARWQTRPLERGGYGWHYDAAIREQMRQPAPAPTQVPDLWPACEAMPGPTLVVRGGASDVLSSETVREMEKRMRRCTSIEVRDVGHAPTLAEPEALAAIQRFLRAT